MQGVDQCVYQCKLQLEVEAGIFSLSAFKNNYSNIT